MVEMATGRRPQDAPMADDEDAVNRGKARAKALSAKKRSAIAKKAARARWGTR